MDIITPHVVHRKTRRKRSPAGEAGPHQAPDEGESVEEKVIKLEGLGRAFQLRLHPNPSLLNFNEFVHLFRHENHSEILSDQIVKSQLPCFYHGSASHHPQPPHHPRDHFPPTPNHYRRTEEEDEYLGRRDEMRKGRVALDICNGLVSTRTKNELVVPKLSL